MDHTAKIKKKYIMCDTDKKVITQMKLCNSISNLFKKINI